MTAKQEERDNRGEVIALCGGVGGAKLALGLQHVLGDRLTVIVNVGDDFDHLGLRICPDLDTVLYTLSGLSDHSRGWGRAGETWHFMQALAELGGETWFNLGDRDLAYRLGVRARVLPATDDVLRTKVLSSEGALDFQRYFVKERCEPRISGVAFEGADGARISQAVSHAMRSDSLTGIVICPSNPYLSIDPILSIPPIQEGLKKRRVAAVAVSPIIGGKAIKGPTMKIMNELGVEPTSMAVVRHYAGLIDGIVVDHKDAASVNEPEMPAVVTDTLMTDLDTRIKLADVVLAFVAQLSRSGCR
jgi:LPPG:FO 2-phospho-L-lactate transferase